MLQAMPGKAIVKKIKMESTIGGIYINDNDYSYQIINIYDNELGLKTNDQIVVKEDAIHFIMHDNQELGIIELKDILAIIK